jgi:hypothetical protein
MKVIDHSSLIGQPSAEEIALTQLIVIN